MKAIVNSSVLQGQIRVPSSKSAMQRALALAWLHRGQTKIIDPGISNDDKAALGIIQQLGAKTFYDGEGNLHVDSGNQLKKDLVINCGESGLSVRMFASIVATLSQQVTLEGSGSLRRRPLNFIEEVLPEIGVDVSSSGGKIPLIINGPMLPRDIEVDGSQSSQYLTGLLLAFAAVTKEKVSIRVKNLNSKPYIDLTLQMMKPFGLQVDNIDYKEFLIHPRKNINAGMEVSVERDWSSASLLLAAAAGTGNISLLGLNLNSVQADRAFAQALELAGANIQFINNTVQLKKGELRAFNFDATDCPDLFPPLVTLAAKANGITKIKGVSRLEHKESNRGLSLQSEFGKMGLNILLENDDMIIEGGRLLNGAAVHSHHDHRIAMALCGAALSASGETIIEDAEAVNKSYPEFYEQVKSAGGDVELVKD